MMRQAILIGCGEYLHEKNLNCIQNDLNEMKEVLEMALYTVHSIYNGTYDEIVQFIDNIKNMCKEKYNLTGGGDYVLIYFSGHGSIYNERNYFLPVDFNGDYNKAINVLDSLEGWDEISFFVKHSWKKILIADMCRKKGEKNQAHGNIRELRNAFVGFSSLENTVSYTKGLMSKFTKEFVENMRVPGMSLVDVFQSTKKAIGWDSGADGQLPICYDSMTSDVYFFNEERFELKTPQEYFEKGKQYLKYSVRKNHSSWRRLIDIGINLIRIAADMGNDEAKMLFADYCIEGGNILNQYGIYGKDYNLAYRYYDAVTEEKKGKALFKIAYSIYLSKNSDLYDYEMGKRLLLESYEKYHYQKAVFKLGELYEDEENYEKAFYYFSICAEKEMDNEKGFFELSDNEKGLFKLGKYYEKGLFVQTSGKISVSYYEKAYKLGKYDELEFVEFEYLKCLYKLANYYHHNDNKREAKYIMDYLRSTKGLDEIIESVRKEKKLNLFFFRKTNENVK